MQRPDFDPVGKPIESYEILGGGDNEADIALTVRPAARFVCTVVTRDWYAATAIRDANLAGVSPDAFGANAYIPPFVVNDPRLTPGVLSRVFEGTVVGPDLGPSLAPVNEE